MSTLTSIPPPPESWRHRWLVIEDPDDVFLGRYFEKQDVTTSAQMKTWPNGITFFNVDTHEKTLYWEGNLYEMKDLWTLYYFDSETPEEGKIIYAGNFTKNVPTCPISIIRRYWPEITDEQILQLATEPITDEATNRKLEWKSKTEFAD
jgi:hypothetical protein